MRAVFCSLLIACACSAQDAATTEASLGTAEAPLLTVSSIYAEEAPPNSQPAGTGFLAQGAVDVLPLPLESPRVIDPSQPVEPLTAGGKTRLALKNTFGYRAILNRMFFAGINQWQDDPYEWPSGMEGFGMRLGTRMAATAVRHSVQLALDVALKTDPRYDRCECVGFMSRTGHALSRIYITRKDDGGETVAVARLAGQIAAPIVIRTWHPDRQNTWNNRMQTAAFGLAWRGVNNIVKEFWPDMKTRFRFMPGQGPSN